MKLPFFRAVLFHLFIFTLLYRLALAAKKPYIVCLGAHPHDVEPKLVDIDKVKTSHYRFLGSLLGSKRKAKRSIHYSYAMHLNAFAASLEEEEATKLADHLDVLSVSDVKASKLHTTHSWEFLGLENNGEILEDSLMKKANFGKDVIIASLDTGVWPESKSFSDEGIGPVPSKWRGICEFNTRNAATGCNRKLIGARMFNQQHIHRCQHLKKQNVNITKGCFDKDLEQSPLDFWGHGTHTLSTAGGNFVPRVNVYGQGNGTAKGGSPWARLAAYKVCSPIIELGNGSFIHEPCPNPEILAGLDAAIADGVDVISLSLGVAESEYFEDFQAIGTFHAVKRGIVVIVSGGNSGPKLESPENVAPWLITVAASTTDRRFTSNVVLGNNVTLKGTSLSKKAMQHENPYPLFMYTNKDKDAMLKGKIVVCGQSDDIDCSDTYFDNLGAAGMIVVISSEKFPAADIYVLPATQISYTEGQILFAYLNSSENPTAYITPVKTEVGIRPSPIMASFSSRGPSRIQPAILKPDITAPGVDIIAAGIDADDPSIKKSRRIPFIMMEGTSVSCPHISGIVGLLKSLHPDWSGAAIKSALMTTARTQYDTGTILDGATYHEATPFAYGAGHVQPNQAMDPGLVYDLSVDDYMNFLCAHGYNQTILRYFSEKPYECSKSFKLLDFNYPSITVPHLGESVTISRKVKNVGSPGTYNVHVKLPTGVSVSVQPSTLTFEKVGEEKIFNVILKTEGNSRPKDYVFGELVWSDGQHTVKSPLVVKHD